MQSESCWSISFLGTMEGRGKKNIFIVFAHPTGRGSLNHAILDITRDELTSQGHTVTVSDLYEMKFNPILTGKESVCKYMLDPPRFIFILLSPILTRKLVKKKDPYPGITYNIT